MNNNNNSVIDCDNLNDKSIPIAEINRSKYKKDYERYNQKLDVFYSNGYNANSNYNQTTFHSRNPEPNINDYKTSKINLSQYASHLGFNLDTFSRLLTTIRENQNDVDNNILEDYLIETLRHSLSLKTASFWSNTSYDNEKLIKYFEKVLKSRIYTSSNDIPCDINQLNASTQNLDIKGYTNLLIYINQIYNVIRLCIKCQPKNTTGGNNKKSKKQRNANKKKSKKLNKKSKSRKNRKY